MIYVLARYHYKFLGYIQFVLSGGAIAILMIYVYGSGVFADEHPAGIQYGIGFFELIILAYAYLNLSLAQVLGKKGMRDI